jgi:hypothetical protein
MSNEGVFSVRDQPIHHREPVSLHDRLTEDLKLATKARDQLRMDVIRMIKAAVMNKEMEIKKDLDDAEMSRVMTTMIKLPVSSPIFLKPSPPNSSPSWWTRSFRKPALVL